MPSVNEQIADRVRAHAVDLTRIEAGVEVEARKIIRRLQKRLTLELASVDPSRPYASRYRYARLEKLNIAAKRMINEEMNRARIIMHDELRELSRHQMGWMQDNINDVVGMDLVSIVPSGEMIRALVTNQLIEGAPSAEWWRRQSQSLRNKFLDEMREGVLRGEGLSDLTRRIRGTREASFTDGIMRTATRNAQALARTSVQSIANASRRIFYENNLDVIRGIVWLATFDGRTTQICISLDGLSWTLPDFKPIGHDIAYPGDTAHWGCRSTQSPVIRSWEELGAKRGVSAIPPSTRASMDGQVPSSMGYEDWLRTKPEMFQRSVLGKTKFDLWRRGEVTFPQLIDNTARPLRVRELPRLTRVP